MRRFWVGVALGLIATLVGGGVWWTLALQPGAPLGEREQAALRARASLPPDFPIHPAARRMPQSPQGGLSYAVNSAVPDVAVWVRDQLRRTGFQVDSAELEGDPEADYKDRWISFRRARSGFRSTGWVIVRQTRLRVIGLPQQSTEVKVLSEQDERLKPAPTPTRAPAPVATASSSAAATAPPVVLSSTPAATLARSS